MHYENIKRGIFISRPNRFIANVEIDGVNEVCHVKNTGRCGELLIKGAQVLVQECDSETRKTKYDLISVYKSDTLVNMDSQSPNKAVHEFLQSGRLFKDIKLIKPEKKYKNSRFDFYVETETDRIFIEVKGVNLEIDGAALFPDAPTERGVKHTKELMECVRDGYKAYVIFVVQMGNVRYFMPNYKTHKELGDTLKQAADSGVNVLAYDCDVTETDMTIRNEIEVRYA